MTTRPLSPHFVVDDGDDSDGDNFQSVLSELMAGQSLDSDFDVAFNLQLQEAINASLTLLPATSSPPPPLSSPPPPPPQPDSGSALGSLDPEISRAQQELADRKVFLHEARRLQEDLRRRVHDQRVTSEILRIPESDWQAWGNNYEKPFCGEASSSSSGTGAGEEDDIFRVYFKGLSSEESIGGNKVIVGGIGVAICDPADNLVMEIRKPLIGDGMNKTAADAKALIEALFAAISLDLKRVTLYCDYYPLYQFIIGRWPPKQPKIRALVDQVALLQKNFTYCNAVLVPRNDTKLSFKLARDAIVAQVTKPVQSEIRLVANENCVICLEDTDVSRMFSVDGCLHRYCFSCMKQHVEVKLLHGMALKCPHDGCKSELNVDSCAKFLTPKLLEIMRLRVKEASIPVSERIYCPYPKCSALMTKAEVNTEASFFGYSGSSVRKCVKCHGLFCIACKIPWHGGLSCDDYKRLHPNPPAEDLKLKSLATTNLWRQCVKCNHMIELAEGCYHMTCRCGFEFCYNCGAEWKNKKATCSCPLWDEDHILHDEIDEDEEDEDDLFDEDEDWDGYLRFL